MGAIALTKGLIGQALFSFGFMGKAYHTMVEMIYTMVDQINNPFIDSQLSVESRIAGKKANPFAFWAWHNRENRGLK